MEMSHPGRGILGCLGGLATAVFVLLLVGGILFAVFGSMRSSPPVQQAFEIARNHPVITERLGTPVELGWFVGGSYSSGGSGGYADIDAPIRGPNGSATLEIKANQINGEWQLTALFVYGDVPWMNLLDE